jgi:hypothetical protein
MFRIGFPCFHDSSIKNWLDVLTAEQRNAIRRIAVHKDEVNQGSLWDYLPKMIRAEADHVLGVLHPTRTRSSVGSRVEANS